MADPSQAPAADPRRALLDAAKALLPTRAPSTVTGRELATKARVNYGLIHHYYGSKDAVFRDAYYELRDEFLDRHPDHGLPELLLEQDDPFVGAVGRAQIDYPNETGPGGEDGFPIGEAVVAGVVERLGAAAVDDGEARARAVAMLALQLALGLYRPMLFASVGVDDEARAAVEGALADIYRSIAGSGASATS